MPVHDVKNHRPPRRLTIGVLLAFVVVLLLAFQWSLRTNPSVDHMLEALPQHVTIQSTTFSSSQPELENERTDADAKYQYLSFDNNGTITHQGNRCYLGSITRIDSSSDAVLLTTDTARLEDGTSSGRYMRLRTPASLDYLNPVGFWAFANIKNGDSSAVGFWAWLNEDGTGFCAQGKRDATNASQKYLSKRGTGCTWHAAQADEGYLITLDYEGGQTTISVVM